MLSDAAGVVRERSFMLPILKDDLTVQNYYTQSKGEEVMKLDNDAKGRADDIYWLQVKSGLAMQCFPMGGLIWCCDDNRDCCQAFPGGCEFCCECCECFERHPVEMHSANSHRLTLYSNCMMFERDAHDRPIVTHWTTVDKYGNVSHHQGERLRHANHAKFHIPLESVSVEIVDMNALPNPIYVSCALSCWEPCCGIEGTKPKGSILAVRLTSASRRVLCCIDCGQNSNALAFKKAFEDARSRNATLAPPQVIQAFETFGTNVASNMNLMSSMMATGQGFRLMQQQMMMNRMNMATTNQQVPVVTATAVPMNSTIPTVTATTVSATTVAPTAPPKEGVMPNGGNAQSAGGGGDLTSQLNQLAQLHQSGALSDAEYQSAKNRVLGLG